MHRRSNTTPAWMFWSPPSDYRRGWWILLFALPALFLIVGTLAGFAGLIAGRSEVLSLVLSVIGFFFRIGRVLFALLMYVATFFAYVFCYIIWLAFPLLCIAGILSPFFAVSSTRL